MSPPDCSIAPLKPLPTDCNRPNATFRSSTKTHLVLGAQVVPFFGNLVGCQFPLKAQALQDGAGGDTQQGGGWGSVLLKG